jgi:hypothetical protein
MATVRMEDIVKGEFGSIYSIVWDGWRGHVILRRDGSGYLWTTDYKNGFGVRVSLLNDPQDNVDGQTGPGYQGVNSALKHRIVFWVDSGRLRRISRTTSASTATSSPRAWMAWLG